MNKVFLKIAKPLLCLILCLTFIFPFFASAAIGGNFNDLTTGTYTATIENYPAPGQKQSFDLVLIADYNGRIYVDEEKSKIPVKDTYDELLPRELTYLGPNGSSMTIDLMSRQKVGDGVTGEIKSDGQGNTLSPAIVATKSETKAATTCTWKAGSGPDAGKYCLLAPLGDLLGGESGRIDIVNGGMAAYLEGMFRAGIAIATGLTLIMIVIGGLQYVSTDAWGGKSEGKEKITQALLGLLLALGTVLIVQELNPTLLRRDLDLNEKITLQRISGPNVDSLGIDISQYPTVDNIVNNATNYNYQVTGTTKFALSDFSNMEWRAYALNQINNTRLPSMKPIDADKFFPGGVVTAEGWLKIVAGIVKLESSFNPRLVFPEPPPLNKNSVGLMQLSYDDAEVRARGYSEEDLKNPLKNLEAGIKILERQLIRHGCISCKSAEGSWRGGAQYWSTLR